MTKNPETDLTFADSQVVKLISALKIYNDTLQGHCDLFCAMWPTMTNAQKDKLIAMEFSCNQYRDIYQYNFLIDSENIKKWVVISKFGFALLYDSDPMLSGNI